MEISNISGADAVPSGFSSEAPRTEEAVEVENNVNRTEEIPENNKGTTVDTYA